MKMMDQSAGCRAMGLAAVVAAGLLVSGCCCGGGGRSSDQPRATGKGVNIYVAAQRGQICKVAILPFKAATELIGYSVSDMFVTELLKGRQFELVERGQIATVLGETELQMSGLTESKAAELGTMLGADGVMIGSVDEYGTVAYKGKTYPVVGVSARLIECGTGKILISADMGCKAKDPRLSLPEHARSVVREMMAAISREVKRCR